MWRYFISSSLHIVDRYGNRQVKFEGRLELFMVGDLYD
jgi:hypothetical protein